MGAEEAPSIASSKQSALTSPPHEHPTSDGSLSTGTSPDASSATTTPLTESIVPPRMLRIDSQPTFISDPRPTTPPQQTAFPQLSNNPPTTPHPSGSASKTPFFPDDKYEESSAPLGFDRTQSLPLPRSREKAHVDPSEIKEEAVHRMHKYTLYETATRYYIVGSDLVDETFRILKLDRTADEGELSLVEDSAVYNRDEMTRLLATIEDGNRSTGGLKQRTPFWGILGFIRFTGPYYMLLITKRGIVATIGGHYIYQIDNTELVPLTTSESARISENNPEESRFLSILSNLDLTRSFYFSYSYDITRTLQKNIIRAREAINSGRPRPERKEYNDMFAWNHYLLGPAVENLKNTFDWCLPVVHGYVDQSSLSVYGRTVYVTIIARRSRYFAGARFLKRGANDLGYVANDVETEQIVSEALTTSFHSPSTLFSNPTYTSYVQHRGSIPLFWTQENNAATPKPPIELNLVDPFFSAAALHFDNMFSRYGAPIIVLNLVKSRERTPRESLLLREFSQAIEYLNQFLPTENAIRHIAWDMSRASKSHGLDVIETLETIAENVLETTGFFHNGDSPVHPPRLQTGVCRTNCIDCLDRTNAAQFVIGKKALGVQLHALGILSTPYVAFDTDAVNLFTHMYHDHGDTIAVQYAGSHLVNTMETYRKINQWTSHSRDMIESFKRYYNNSFLDGQRQEAYNLFLGNYIWAQGQPMLWDLSSDYYLHHSSPQALLPRRSYRKWWTPANLLPENLPEAPAIDPSVQSIAHYDSYWEEYYRPRVLTNFLKLHAYNINSTLKYIPLRMTRSGLYDLSPFAVRSRPISRGEDGAGGKKRKAPKLVVPWFKKDKSDEKSDEDGEEDRSIEARRGSLRETQLSKLPDGPRSQWPLPTLVKALSEPFVPVEEEAEYRRYLTHALFLPLISEDPSAYLPKLPSTTTNSSATSTAPSTPPLQSNEEEDEDVKAYIEYVHSTPGGFGGVEEEEEEGKVAFYEQACAVPEMPLAIQRGEEGRKRYRAYWKVVGGRGVV